MLSSLRSRLWLSYALVIATALGIVAGFLLVYLIRNPILYRQTLERLRAVQALVVARETEQQFRSDLESAERISRTFGVRVLFFSQDKHLIADTRSETQPALPFPERKVLNRLESTPLIRDEEGAPWIYSIEKLSDDTFLMVASPRPRIAIVNVFSNELMPIFLQGGVIALCLSLAVAFLVARWIAEPLQKVVLAARTLPSENIPLVPVSGPHEVQDLTRAFNLMVGMIQASQKSQRDFVADVSHELKTPLTSIQGFAQAMLDGTAETKADREQAAQVIYSEAGRMHRMVLDLLDLARLDSGTAKFTLAPVDLAGLLRAVSEKFSPQLQRAGVLIDLQIAPTLPLLSADGDRLAQVFTNLVENALKFTPNGGRITLSAFAVGKEMFISVADTGAGIPPQAQPHIFDRFYQADPSRKGGKAHGTGLGLAIAHEIVLAHGGRIRVHSRPGEGTVFEIFLPLP